MDDHINICHCLVNDFQIKNDLVSVIWYGSSSKGVDLHPRSDCDLQIVLKSPNKATLRNLNELLEAYPHVDLSVVYLSDIFDKKGNVVFQSGTKGNFFVHVLSKGKVLFGADVYAKAASQVSLRDARESLFFTIKEYLTRLRIMATHSPNDTLRFKKYSLKLFQDILALKGVIPLSELAACTYKESQQKIQSAYLFDAEAKLALKKITDFDDNYSKSEMAALLYCYEQLVQHIKEEQNLW